MSEENEQEGRKVEGFEKEKSKNRSKSRTIRKQKKENGGSLVVQEEGKEKTDNRRMK